MAHNLTPTPLLLQWYCRGLRANAYELNERLHSMADKPIAALLQETRGTGPSVHGYRGYAAPTIRRVLPLRSGLMAVMQEVAVYVRQGVHHCQVPTVKFGSDVQEVVAVKISLSPQKLLVA